MFMYLFVIWLILDRDKYHNRLCFWWTKQSHMDLFVITLKAKRMMIFDLIHSMAYLVKCDPVGVPSTNSKRLNELWTVPRYKFCIFFTYFILFKLNSNWAHQISLMVELYHDLIYGISIGSAPENFVLCTVRSM